MIRRDFKAGDQMDAMSVAGADCFQLEAHGIVVDVFEKADQFQIPLIFAEVRGSGKLDAFLDDLRQTLVGKRIVFVSVINGRLAVRLLARGFEVKTE